MTARKCTHECAARAQFCFSSETYFFFTFLSPSPSWHLKLPIRAPVFFLTLLCERRSHENPSSKCFLFCLFVNSRAFSFCSSRQQTKTVFQLSARNTSRKVVQKQLILVTHKRSFIITATEWGWVWLWRIMKVEDNSLRDLHEFSMSCKTRIQYCFIIHSN